MNFMLIYMGEYTDEVLTRCRIEEVNEVVLGFSEMATIKIGELMNVPRNTRIQQLKAAEAKKKERQQAEGRRREDEAKAAAKRARVASANRKAHREVMVHVEQWARGEGGEAELKRYGRRHELQLLVMGVALTRTLTLTLTQVGGRSYSCS